MKRYFDWLTLAALLLNCFMLYLLNERVARLGQRVIQLEVREELREKHPGAKFFQYPKPAP